MSAEEEDVEISEDFSEVKTSICKKLTINTGNKATNLLSIESKKNEGDEFSLPDMPKSDICTTSECPKPLVVPVRAKQMGHEKVRVVEKRFARSMETPSQSEFHSGEFTLIERVKSTQPTTKKECH